MKALILVAALIGLIAVAVAFGSNACPKPKAASVEALFDPCILYRPRE